MGGSLPPIPEATNLPGAGFCWAPIIVRQLFDECSLVRERFTTVSMIQVCARGLVFPRGELCPQGGNCVPKGPCAHLKGYMFPLRKRWGIQSHHPSETAFAFEMWRLAVLPLPADWVGWVGGAGMLFWNQSLASSFRDPPPPAVCSAPRGGG